MAAAEILKHICQLAGYSRSIQREHTIDNVIGACAIG